MPHLFPIALLARLRSPLFFNIPCGWWGGCKFICFPTSYRQISVIGRTADVGAGVRSPSCALIGSNLVIRSNPGLTTCFRFIESMSKILDHCS